LPGTILIRDATIVDGSGRRPFRGSILIVGDRIQEVVEGPSALTGTADVVIDASGLIACPGLIDMHAHGDETLFLYPTADNYVLQGVTTIVGGNCGFSPAPIRDWWLMSFWEYDWWHEIEPYKYYAPIMHPIEKVNEKLKEKLGFTIDWRTFGEYLQKIREIGTSVNYVPMVGHNTIRTAVMGNDYKRRARPEEVEEMRRLVREAMDSGAHGMSTGLDYEPGSYADTEELVELARVVAEYGGIYATHWRRTGVRKEVKEVRRPEKIKGILEAIEIGKKAKVSVQISHLLSGYTIYPPPPPILAEASAKATLQVIDEARGKGLDVTFDVIPNTTGGVFAAPELVSLLTPWLREAGSRERLAEHLRAKDVREEIREVINAGRWWAINPKVNPFWMDSIRIVKCKVKAFEGKTVGEIAEERGADPLDTLFDILQEDPYAKMIYEHLIEEVELITYLRHPACMIGIDTFALDDKWGMKTPPYYLPHPNTYSGYVHYLTRYVRELHVLSLEEAIRKATSLPARRMGLTDRGVIRPGAYADLTIFDLQRLQELGTYLEPRRYPKGVNYVIVNGEIVVKNGKHTGVRAGRVIPRADRRK